MIGLELDRDYINVAELKESSGGLTLTKFASARVSARPEEKMSQAISRTISEVFAENQIETKDVYAGISGPRVQSRRISLPFMPEKELNEAVKWETKNFVPFPVESAAIDYYQLKEIEKKATKQDLFVVAAEGEALKKYIGLFKNAGIKHEGVTPVSFALWELTKLHPEFSTDKLVALVNIGIESTSLNLYKNQTLLFTREIEIAGQSITDALVSSLKIKNDEAAKIKIKYGLPAEGETGFTEEGVNLDELRVSMLAVFGKLYNELISSFQYYQEQFFEEKISRLFIAGESALLKNLKDYLAANLGVPVDILDPLRNLQIDAKIDPDKLKEAAPRLAPAIGLALGKGKKINLYKVKAGKGEQAYESLKFLEVIQIPNTAIIGTLVSFLMIIFGLNFYLSVSIGKAKDALDNKSVKLSQMIKFRDRKLAFQDITKREINVNLLLARINSLMPEGVSLVSLDFDHDKRAVKLEGESANPRAASDLAKKIEESPFFSRALLIEIKKVGKIITFKMEFQVN
ncbi:MAG: type IV pilus assembly protein PilM [Candidatus Margulisiibacteriota bacterium]